MREGSEIYLCVKSFPSKSQMCNYMESVVNDVLPILRYAQMNL